MAVKKISTTVSTGDVFTGTDGNTYKVGLFRKIDGKNVINLFVRLSPTSGYTRQVSTRELNKLIGN